MKTIQELLEAVRDEQYKIADKAFEIHGAHCGDVGRHCYRAACDRLIPALTEAVEALERYNNGGIWMRDTTILNASTALQEIRALLEGKAIEE